MVDKLYDTPILSLASILLLSPLAMESHGVAISVNFSGGPPLGAFDPPTAFALNPTDVAGVVPVANWNNAPSRTGTINNLVSSTGAATTASVTWAVNGTFQVAGINAALSPDHTMMKSHLDARFPAASFGTPEDAIVTFSNIPATFGVYDVIVYFDADTANGTVNSNYTIGAQTFFVSDTTTFNGTFVQGTGTTAGSRSAGANYVRFNNLTAPSFIMTADSETFRAEVSGIQIVAHAIPEPASMALLLMGIPALVARRRARVC
jgi:hypothetical protein